MLTLRLEDLRVVLIAVRVPRAVHPCTQAPKILIAGFKIRLNSSADHNYSSEPRLARQKRDEHAIGSLEYEQNFRFLALPNPKAPLLLLAQHRVNALHCAMSRQFGFPL